MIAARVAAAFENDRDVQATIVKGSLGELSVSLDGKKVIDTNRLLYPRPSKDCKRHKNALNKITKPATQMDKAEAKLLLSEELSRYRALPYAELFSLIDHEETFERTAPSGVTYQIEMQVFVDDASRQTLRVMGSIDDGGWRAFVPL